MNDTIIFVLLLIVAVVGYVVGKGRAMSQRKQSSLHSLPKYYGLNVATWALIPAIIVFAIWSFVSGNVVTGMTVNGLPAEMLSEEQDITLVANEIKNVAIDGMDASSEAIKQAAERYTGYMSTSQLMKFVVVMVLSLLGLVYGLRSINPKHRARNQFEKVVYYALLICAMIAILTTVGIVFSVLFESIRFFGMVSPFEFFFGTTWSPQTAMRADQVGSSGSFGAVPLFVGTFLISIIALSIAVPFGLFSAIYLSEYANSKVRSFAKPMLEILAGVPTVVYGFFAALTIAPLLREFGQWAGLEVASESALAAGLVMGVMIIPFVSSISDDVISAVPDAMRDGALGMGSTRSEMITKVVVPAALPGIVAGVLLAASRAIGETMIVVMAAGLAANMTANPFDAVTTVTVQIVTLLTGDQEFDSAKTLAAFALGLSLFVVTLLLNIVALHIVRKYREQYE
jgi:phosphate transport system permease protein